VTIRTLPNIMVGRRGVTGSAIGELAVVERHTGPGTGDVAVGAFAWVMIVSLCAGMASLASGQTAVIEVNVLPAVFLVAVGALPGIVVAGFGVAVLAVVVAFMIEVGQRPVGSNVAI
jgi:hypothetical protein